MPIIEVENLSREFQVMESVGRFLRRKKTVHAVRGINFTVEPGEAVGYIGANGAGKSTTIKMLTGVLVPSSGRVTVCGFNPVPQRKALARKIGVVFGQRSQLWWDLPLQDSYPILGAMHRMSEADWRPRFRELADQMDLGEFLTTPVRQLSLGQRMRGEVAAALLHRPELVILDEPTIGLDMISKAKLRQFLDAERRENGTTLLLTTHDMSDIQRLCQRVLVVDDGAIAYDGPLTGLADVAGAVRTMVVDLAAPCTRLFSFRFLTAPCTKVLKPMESGTAFPSIRVGSQRPPCLPRFPARPRLPTCHCTSRTSSTWCGSCTGVRGGS
ncbi:ATP-binding cassette domain-containing protein [Arthrobacter sp. D3-18]